MTMGYLNARDAFGCYQANAKTETLANTTSVISLIYFWDINYALFGSNIPLTQELDILHITLFHAAYSSLLDLFADERSLR